MGYFEDEYPGVYDPLDETEFAVPKTDAFPDVFYVDKVILPTPVTLKPVDTLTITYTITVSHA